MRKPQHPREHVVRQQPDVVGEHAEDEPVDEVGHRLRVVAALPQRLRHRRERRRGALRQRLPRLHATSAGRGSRVAASPRSSNSNSCVRLTLFVQFVRIRNRTMSETISPAREPLSNLGGGSLSARVSAPLVSPGRVVVVSIV